MIPRSTSRCRRRRRVFLGVIMTGAALAGCGAPTPGVSNGSVSACFRAIPVGQQAVDTKQTSARLIGVHRIPLDTVRSRLPAAARAMLAQENDTAVCVMAFSGKFGPGQVAMANPSDQGRYALIVVSSRKLHLIAAVVLESLPKSFGGRTV